MATDPVGSDLKTMPAEDGQEWDAVVLVRHPNRTVFDLAVADPEYRAVTELHTRALAETVLQPTSEWVAEV
ncbi:hypothetical protein ABZ092_00270 [Streptomyces bobili]|uniref:hypothetical protein n=1 Tax=Streptomyces bobili TaxID=67280 RepID=UPI0033B0DF9D